jgi:hypothetical protein
VVDTLPPTRPLTPVDAWQVLAPDLDAAWGTDTPRTVDLLAEFLVRFPDDSSAKEKLYAALVSRADQLVEQGAAAEAAAQLVRAERILPERLEATVALSNLTLP